MKTGTINQQQNTTKSRQNARSSQSVVSRPLITMIILAQKIEAIKKYGIRHEFPGFDENTRIQAITLAEFHSFFEKIIIEITGLSGIRFLACTDMLAAVQQLGYHDYQLDFFLDPVLNGNLGHTVNLMFFLVTKAKQKEASIPIIPQFEVLEPQQPR